MPFTSVIANVWRDLSRIMDSEHAGSKPALIGQCLKMTATDIAIRRGMKSPPETQQIGEYNARFFSYGMLCALWKEIFVDTPYYFKATSDRPAILDVGSNIGMSVLYFKHLYPNSTVTAFEPDPRAFGVLKSNVERNQLTGVTLVNKAVIDHNGTVTWHYNDEHPESLSMSTSPRDTLPNQAAVSCVRLSEFIDGPIDFLKLDVEGAEGAVIRELSTSGKLPLINKMAIEYHPWGDSKDNRLDEILETLKNGGRMSVRYVGADPHPGMIFATI